MVRNTLIGPQIADAEYHLHIHQHRSRSFLTTRSTNNPYPEVVMVRDVDSSLRMAFL